MTWTDEDVVLIAGIAGIIVAACVAYMLGYWDGYHAICVGGQP